MLGRMIHEGKHVRSWDLSHGKKEVWEWDCGVGKHWEPEYGVGSAFSMREVVHTVMREIVGLQSWEAV